MPILILALVAAATVGAVYVLKNKFGPDADPTRALPESGAPQMFTPAEKLAFFKTLPGKLIADVQKTIAGSSSYDAGQILPAGSTPTGSSELALAFILRVNMQGHSILIAPHPTTATISLIAVPADEALATSLAAPRSRWSIFLGPNEAAALASDAGALDGGMAGITPGDKKPDDKKPDGKVLPPSGSNKMLPAGDAGLAKGLAGSIHAELLGKIRKAATSPATMSVSKLPTKFAPAVKVYDAGGPQVALVEWADKLATDPDGPYTVAARAFYDMARAIPIPRWPNPQSHKEMMSVVEIAAYPTIVYEDGSSVSLTIKDRFQTPDGKRGYPPVDLARAARFLDEAKTSPAPGLVSALVGYATLYGEAGYLAAADEFGGSANVIAPGSWEPLIPLPVPAVAPTPPASTSKKGGSFGPRI